MEDEPRPDVGQAAKRLAWIGLATAAAMLILSAWAWTRIPPGTPIAVHWGATGAPNGFMGKTAGLFFMPALAILMTVIMLAFLAIPRSQPVRSMKAYLAVGTSILGVLLATHIVSVLLAVGWKFNAPAIVLTIMGIMLAVIGNYFPKMRRNRWMGVRTPWTRASDECWNKTHRMAGPLFVALGIGIIVLAWSPVNLLWEGPIVLVGILGVTLFIYAYSYVVWRTEKGSTAGPGES